MPYKPPLPDAFRFQQSAWGLQDELMLIAVPAAASAALVGQKLVGQTLTVDGVYYCIIPLSGLVQTLQVHIQATFAAGSVTTAGPDTLYYVTSMAPASFTVKTAGTGDGALSTTVLQTATLTGMLGEQYALVTLTLSGTSALFTRAEYNGI